MRLGVAAALVGETVVPGDVAVRDGRVDAVGLPGGGRGLAAPGFVDLQVNGVAGVDVLHADPEDLARAGAALAAAGVVAWRPTLISAPPDALRRALRSIATAAAIGRESTSRRPGDATSTAAALPAVLGAHLEGPFLSPAWPGAHDPAHLRPVDDALVDALLAAGPVTQVTLAPELPGGLALVERLARAGVLVGLGHTDADATTAHAAFDHGARTVTHLHNAQRRWAARDPGVAGAALVRDDVVLTLIADGVHLAPETVLLAFRAAPGRVALVSDAMAATGLPPGRHRLGDQDVLVTGDGARRPDGRLAGSIVTLDGAVRHAVAAGVDRDEALLAASTVPARLAGRDGTLRPGAPADVVVLDDDLRVVRTLVAGAEAFAG